MKIKSLFFLSVFYFISASVFSQKTDKESNAGIYEKINYYRGLKISTDSLFYYAKEMQNSKDACIKIRGKNIEANIYYKVGNYKESEKICLQILSMVKDSTSECQTKNKFNALGRLFWIKKNTSQYKLAFDYLIEKEKIFNQAKLKDNKFYLQKFSVEPNKALIKSTLGFHNEAIEILKRGINKIEKLNIDTSKDKYYFTFHKSSAYNILGDTYIKSSKNHLDKKLDTAAYYYKQAYESALLFDPPHKDTEQLYQLRTIKVKVAKKKYKSALKSIHVIDSLNIITETTQDINFLKSQIFYNLKRVDSSLHYAHQFLNYHKNTPSTKKNRIVIYDILANEYHALKKVDSAFKYSELGLKELTELNNHKTEINKTQYIHDFNKINELNNSQINKEHTSHVVQLALVITGSILLIILLVIYFYRRRKRTTKKFNSIIEEIQTTEAPPKKDYNIEQELQDSIFKQLEELENSKLFLKSDFSIQLLAKNLDTNTTYISYLINNTKNQSFKQYVAKLRIDYLMTLLENDKKYRKYTIQTMAEDIGYTNASAFTRAFKKQVGVTPSAYIKSLN